MSAAVNSMIGAQSDSTGGGAGGSVFGSIAVEVAAPEVVSSHPSLVYSAGSESKIGAGSSEASKVPSGGRVRSCPS